jgi:hypothetical protein
MPVLMWIFPQILVRRLSVLPPKKMPTDQRECYWNEGRSFRCDVQDALREWELLSLLAH